MLKKINTTVEILLKQGCDNLKVDKRAKTTTIEYKGKTLKVLPSGNVSIKDGIEIPWDTVKKKRFNIANYV